MKHVLALFIVTAITRIDSYVISDGKDVKASATLKAGAKKLNDKREEALKTFTSEEREVYLDDVLYAIMNQNWTAEEEPCLNQTLRMLRGLQNFTLWAVWQWDSISSEPQALLYGNRFHLGNFDQCIEAPWYKSHPDLRNQYCLADIVLERTDKVARKRINEPENPYQSALDRLEHRSYFSRPLNYLTWGLCVPSSCQPQSVQRLLGILLAQSHLGAAGLQARIKINEPCQSSANPRQYDALFYSFILVISLFSAIVLICTYIRHKRADSEENKTSNAILNAMCLKNNWKDLCKMNKDGIEVMYGLRFLGMCFVTLDHQYGIVNGGPTSNGAMIDEAALSLLGMLILHNDLFVDTFFVLSGFLSAKGLSSFKRFPNPLAMILKRYVRLAVAFALVIYYVCAVYPFTGSGPLWSEAVAHETAPCRKNWWLGLLMLNNYVDSENICIVVSWYIPCDFHYFVVTMALYWLYRKLPTTGIICAVLISIAAFITPGIVNYLYQLPPIQLFTYDFISNPRGPRQFHLTYIKSHTRYAAYVIGFMSGLYYANRKANNSNIPRKYSTIGVYFALAVMLTLMLYGATYVWRSYNAVGGAVYAALDRPIWACSVALLIICCSLGHVPILKSFLSWYVWAPLSRLSYGLYLVHSIIISRNVFTTRGSQYSDHTNNLIQAIGVMVCGCIIALYMLLVFELPLNNLLDLWLKRRSRKVDTKPMQSSTSKDEVLPANSRGHIQENLPSPENIISKI